MMDYVAFCHRFFMMTGIPVSLLEGAVPVYSSLGKMISYLPEAPATLYAPERNPEFVSLTGDIEYGHVRIEGTDYDLFIGPLFSAPVSEHEIQLFFAEQQIPPEYKEQLTELLYAIPLCSHPQCLRYLVFLHLCLNHKDLTEDSFYAEADNQLYQRTKQQIEADVEAKENDSPHNSYTFELQMYHLIELGDVGRLKAFLESTRTFPEEGKMARSPLRQAKNIFIGVATKAIMLGAIPGGLDIEKAYQLLDLYVLECEQMQSIEEVHRLQYIMLMDFCQRTGNARIPSGISSEIYRCITFIKNHTNEALTVEDVAGHINRSRSYLMRRFKAETGMQVNAYITDCKMAEACDLLMYSHTPLSEISAYLGFSSQSYFQNVFKKQFGMTPMQYRKINSKIK